MRLIDADALVETFEKNARIAARFGSNAPAFRYLELAFAVNNAPTVDAVPARHGKWIRTGRPNIYGGTELECNLCKDRVMVQDVSREHYCRNCGARMDKGGADNETD